MEEHVWFYGRMKGMSMGEVKKEINSLLEDVGLQHKRHEQTKNLSGRLPNTVKPKFIQTPSTFLTLSQFIRYSLENVIKYIKNSS